MKKCEKPGITLIDFFHESDFYSSIWLEQLLKIGISALKCAAPSFDVPKWESINETRNTSSEVAKSSCHPEYIPFVCIPGFYR